MFRTSGIIERSSLAPELVTVTNGLSRVVFRGIYRPARTRHHMPAVERVTSSIYHRQFLNKVLDSQSALVERPRFMLQMDLASDLDVALLLSQGWHGVHEASGGSMNNQVVFIRDVIIRFTVEYGGCSCISDKRFYPSLLALESKVTHTGAVNGLRAICTKFFPFRKSGKYTVSPPPSSSLSFYEVASPLVARLE